METQPASILLLDDDPEVLRLLRGILADHGYTVHQSSDAALALADVQRNPPDLVLLDLVMPRIDGYAMCAELKAELRTASIPVIFISALNEAFDKVRAFAVGAVDYITKPFEADEVLARVATHVTLRRAQQQLEAQNTRLEEEIAERKQAEDALRASQTRYRTLVHHFPNGAVFLFDHDLRFLIADGTALAAANRREVSGHGVSDQ